MCQDSAPRCWLQRWGRGCEMRNPRGLSKLEPARGPCPLGPPEEPVPPTSCSEPSEVLSDFQPAGLRGNTAGDSL